MKIGFDKNLYMQKQSEHILKRIDQFDKLYLEFGGKIFDDFHASRVLPGFEANGKIKLLQKLKDKTEIIFSISAGDIEKNKIRADIGITYDMDVLRLMDNIRKMGIYISSIVITQYVDQPAADIFKNKLERRGEHVYIHRPIKGYPNDIERIVSDEGYGMNPYIETTRPLVVVTAPGPGSGKLATCLSQLYHEHKMGKKAGYAKFETFPIWNIPLHHPVNLAYEAATADLKDVNLIDSFHLEAYGVKAVNYNRDLEAFPIVKNILSRITNDAGVYQSPTDMGVNMAGYGIFDDNAVQEAAQQEIIRRYYKCWCDHKLGRVDIEVPQRVEAIMQQLELKPEDRKVVRPALEKAELRDAPAMAVELDDGTIITGKSSNLMCAAASTMLNAVKHLAGIPDDVYIISPVALEPIMNLKSSIFGIKNPMLNLEEILIALSMSAARTKEAAKAVAKLDQLKGCEAHSTILLTQADEEIFRKLGMNLTCEPEFPTNDLYYQ